MRKYALNSEASQKREIQRLLREIVILRDKKCMRCGRQYHKNDGIVWQCDHLHTRSHAASYSDSRLCVLLCKGCHAWKSIGPRSRQSEFDSLIRSRLSPERVKLWDMTWQSRFKASKQNWSLHIKALNQELSSLQSTTVV